MMMSSIRKWVKCSSHSICCLKIPVVLAYTHTHTNLLFFFQNQKLFIARVNFGANPFQHFVVVVWNHPFTSLSTVFQLKMCSCDNGLSSFIRNETKNTLGDREPSPCIQMDWAHVKKIGSYSTDIKSPVLTETGCCEQLKNTSDPVLPLAGAQHNLGSSCAKETRVLWFWAQYI